MFIDAVYAMCRAIIATLRNTAYHDTMYLLSKVSIAILCNTVYRNAMYRASEADIVTMCDNAHRDPVYGACKARPCNLVPHVLCTGCGMQSENRFKSFRWCCSSCREHLHAAVTVLRSSGQIDSTSNISWVGPASWRRSPCLYVWDCFAVAILSLIISHGLCTGWGEGPVHGNGGLLCPVRQA